MTELEKLQRAKMYIDKLANGINPIDDTVAPDGDIINHVRLSRCFFYVSDILRQVIENGGTSRKKTEPPKPPFFLTEEQSNKYVPSDTPITISEITRSLNNIADLEKCKKLNYSLIADWLINIGALEIKTDSSGKHRKCPTKQGFALGITSETRTGMKGEYCVVVYSNAAQQFIVDNLEAITSFSQSNSKTIENQGKPWTQAQDDCLVELFNKNVPISEIAITLLRTETGIRARLKKFGLIDNISDI